MNYESNGQVFEQAIKILGLNVKLVKEVISPQVATYYYNCTNINQLTEKRLKDIVYRLTHYYHKKFSVVESEISHFAISRPLTQRKTLWLGALKQPDNPNAINIGKGLTNEDIILNFEEMSHLLIAGTTGSGKSILMNDIIMGLYINMGGDNFEMYIADPKGSYNEYARLPNCECVEETTDIIALFENTVALMERRYDQLKENPNLKLKHIFIVVDELADLMLSSQYEIEETIVRLAQKARAAKIHLILATQRPTVNVITGLIKANMPNRICLQMVSGIDSTTMLGHKGAEKLLGRGDAIIKYATSTNEYRFQCAMITNEQIKEAIDNVHIKKI